LIVRYYRSNTILPVEK